MSDHPAPAHDSREARAAQLVQTLSKALHADPIVVVLTKAGQGALTTIRNLLDDAGHSRVSIQDGKLDDAEGMLAVIAQANRFAHMGTSPRTHVIVEKWNDQADMEPERTVAALVAQPRDLFHEKVGLVVVTRSRKVASSLAAKAGTNVIEFVID